MWFVSQRPITAGRVYFFPLKQMSVWWKWWWHISTFHLLEANMTSPRPTTHQNNTGANKALTRLPMVENFSFAPLPLSNQAAPEGMRGCFFTCSTPLLLSLLLLLRLFACYRAAVRRLRSYQTWDLASRLLRKHSGVPLSSVVQKPPHYCLFKLYMKISHCMRGWWFGFLS